MGRGDPRGRPQGGIAPAVGTDRSFAPAPRRRWHGAICALLPVRLRFRFAQATQDTTLRYCVRAVARAQMFNRTSRVRSIDAFKMIERQDFPAQAQFVFILRRRQASRLRKRQTGVYPDLGSSLSLACRFDHGAGRVFHPGALPPAAGCACTVSDSTYARSRPCRGYCSGNLAAHRPFRCSQRTPQP